RATTGAAGRARRRSTERSRGIFRYRAVSSMKCNTFAVRNGGVDMGNCYSHLSSMEREEISRAVALGCGVRLIAWQLGRSASTVSRELRRNAERPTHYRATTAQ